MRKQTQPWHVVRLAEYSSKDNRNFVGRICGMEISRRAGLRSLISNNSRIRVNFPKDTTGVNSVFVEELIGDLFKSLPEGQQISHYFTIENDSLYNVEAMLAKAVDSLRSKKAGVAGFTY